MIARQQEIGLSVFQTNHSDVDDDAVGRTTSLPLSLVRHLYVQPDHLPRLARDKHRKRWRNRGPFSAGLHHDGGDDCEVPRLLRATLRCEAYPVAQQHTKSRSAPSARERSSESDSDVASCDVHLIEMYM
jgi:hypothetical protein|eukprot:COSAG06_NODE_3300_length_5535_cov_8.894776_4_plen_130_part_00